MVLEGEEGSGLSRPELGYVSWLAEKAALTPAVARTGEQAARSQAGEGPAQSAVSSAHTVVPLWGGKNPSALLFRSTLRSQASSAVSWRYVTPLAPCFAVSWLFSTAAEQSPFSVVPVLMEPCKLMHKLVLFYFLCLCRVELLGAVFGFASLKQTNVGSKYRLILGCEPFSGLTKSHPSSQVTIY